MCFLVLILVSGAKLWNMKICIRLQMESIERQNKKVARIVFTMCIHIWSNWLNFLSLIRRHAVAYILTVWFYICKISQSFSTRGFLTWSGRGNISMLFTTLFCVIFTKLSLWPWISIVTSHRHSFNSSVWVCVLRGAAYHHILHISPQVYELL